jgi:hypothetical protein
MRGQYLTLEYIIFFMIGVFMIVSVYYTFSSISDTYRNSIMQNQLKMTGELVGGTIIQMYEASNNTNSSINYSLSIPVSISGCIYSVNAINGRLNLNCTNIPQKGISLNLYNFNTSNKNIIYSTNGFIKLFAKDGKVELS